MRSWTAAVAVRDGVHLATDVRLPDGEGPWPATLFRTPYLRTNEFLPLEPSADLQLAVVLQDVRGRFGSEGDFDLGARDSDDGTDTIAWIRRQPWCDGRVAMHGVSYAGRTQLQAARRQPEGLVSIAPTRCPAWWRPLTMHEAGALQLSLAAHWLPLQAMEAPGCSDATRRALAQIAVTFDQICDYPAGPPTAQCTLNLERAAQHPGLSRRPFIDRPEYAPLPAFADAWRRLFATPFTESWVTDPGPQPGDAPDCPALILSGWYDCWAQDAVAMAQQLQRRENGRTKLVMTPFSHAPEPAGELDTGPDARRFDDWAAIAWNREWLFDRSRALRDLAPVTYFVVNANRWCEAPAWPPPGSRAHTLFLQCGPGRDDGSLRDEPAHEERSVSFVYDPRDPMPSLGGAALGLPAGPVEQARWGPQHRGDVCSFTGEPLTEDVDLCGPVEATLFVASDARDTDVVVKVLDVFPDGRVYNICDGIVRARFRRGGGDESLLVPGAVERYRIHCWNIAYRVRAGHRLRVDVTSSSFPKYEPNANTGAPLGTDRMEDLRPAVQTVRTGGSCPSGVTVTAMRSVSRGR